MADGVESGDQQVDDESGPFVGVKGAVAVGVQEAGDQVVAAAGVGRPALDQGVGVAGECGVPRLDSGELSGVAVECQEQAGVLGGRQDEVVVVGRDADQAADDGQRERFGYQGRMRLSSLGRDKERSPILGRAGLSCNRTAAAPRCPRITSHRSNGPARCTTHKAGTEDREDLAHDLRVGPRRPGALTTAGGGVGEAREFLAAEQRGAHDRTGRRSDDQIRLRQIDAQATQAVGQTGHPGGANGAARPEHQRTVR
ncbi:hypothetical protein ACGFY6_20265 [Streptomyces sp. NPDC048387]|uniref:hypothetical protein n=1 Tax=Streptomyces sp. NPDC048387 TaxID=3365542 RepID=UPI003718FDC9